MKEIILKDLSKAKNYTLSVVEAMPEKQLDFRPVENVRSFRELIHHIAEFAARESCGKCTPCRRGSERMAQVFAEGVVSGREFDELNAALLQTSLCGLGTGLAEFTTTALRHYREELASCIT